MDFILNEKKDVKKEYKYRTYRKSINTVKQERDCLSCDKTFRSQSPANRTCHKCKDKNKAISLLSDWV